MRKEVIGAGKHEGRKRGTKEEGSPSEKDAREGTKMEGMWGMGGKQEEEEAGEKKGGGWECWGWMQESGKEGKQEGVG